MARMHGCLVRGERGRDVSADINGCLIQGGEEEGIVFTLLYDYFTIYIYFFKDYDLKGNISCFLGGGGWEREEKRKERDCARKD